MSFLDKVVAVGIILLVLMSVVASVFSGDVEANRKICQWEFTAKDISTWTGPDRTIFKSGEWEPFAAKGRFVWVRRQRCD